MNFTIKELNELIYSLGITALNGRMLDKELNQSLMEKFHAELGYQLALEAEDEEADDDENYLTIPSEDEIRSHYVSNKEADEDALINFPIENWVRELTSFPIKQDVKKSEDKQEPKPKKIGEGTAQSILDYVERNGSATHKEMQEYYKSLNGSNTFAYCLKNLIIPYKNRKTQRYLIKNDMGKYEVRTATIQNWVEKYY